MGMTSGLSMAPTLAQGLNNGMGTNPNAVLVVALLFGVLFAVLAVMLFVIWLIYGAIRSVPPQYRFIQPWVVWLMIIPVVGQVVAFLVAIQVPQSFRYYFGATGRPQPGDYGFGVGLTWAICNIAIIIPVLGTLAFIAGLVCLILFLVKITSLKRALMSGSFGMQGFDVLPPPPQQRY